MNSQLQKWKRYVWNKCEIGWAQIIGDPGTQSRRCNYSVGARETLTML